MNTIGLAKNIRFTDSIRKNFLRSFLVLILVIFGLDMNTIHAAYLKNVPQTLIQPDGTTLNCFATGDEFYHWLHDANNFTIVQDSNTGYYVYARKAEGKLVPTSIIAGKSDPAAAGLEPSQNIDPEQVISASKEMFQVPALKGSSMVTTTGTINNIVIFIRFSDQSEFTDPMAKYSVSFNGSGSGSMVEYFKEVSGSQLTINTSFFPQSGSETVVSVQDANARNYYCKYNAVTNTIGYQNETERSNREMALVRDATEAVKSQLESTGLNYDLDNNGQVDNVCYVVQGSTDGWAELLWPHMWALYAHNVSIGNAKVWNYNLQLSQTFGVHILCHEMSHSLGFPDLYRYTNNTINPVGPWDVMSGTTNPPQHHTVYTKEKYGKWTSGIPQIATAGTYTLRPLSADPFAAYKIASPNSSSEYFVVEYRKTSGMFEAQLLGSGLVIYRVSPGLNGNTFGPPDELYVCRPNGTTTTDGNLAEAFYSSNSGRTTFGGTSATSCFLSNGAPGGFQITNIGTAGETISFTVTFGDAPPPVLAITPLSREMSVTAGSTSFTVSNTGSGTMSWSAAVTTGSNWARITSGLNGTNAGTISVSVDANPGSTPRTAVITVTAADATGSPKTITLVQAANSAAMSITPDTRSTEAIGGPVSFSVSNTGGGTLNWSASVSTGSNWAQITSGTSGSNSGTINVTLATNTETTSRTATITVTAEGITGSPKTLTITQESAPQPILNAGPQNQNLSSETGTTSFSVTNTGGGQMAWTATVTPGSSWAQITEGTDGVNNGSILVSVDANTGSTSRTAIITVAAANTSTETKTLTITQEGAPQPVLNAGPATQSVAFSTASTSFSVTNTGGGNLNWTATVNPESDFIQIINGKSGINDGTIFVSVEENPDNEYREAFITVKENGGSGAVQTLKIIQEPNKPVLNINRATQEIEARGGTANFTLSNTGGGNLIWSAAVTSGGNWVNIISETSGTNTGSLIVEAGTNHGLNRSATITITTVGAVVNQITVTVNQMPKAAELEIDPVTQTVDFDGANINFGVSKVGFGTITWSAEVTEGNEWVHIVAGVNGSDEGKIIVEVDPNNTSARTAIITVKSSDLTAEPKIITINQDFTNGINEVTAGNNLTVYPNPSVKDFTVQLDGFNGSQKRLDVLNMMGQIESTRILTQETTSVDCSDLSKGMYIFRVTSENNEVSFKRVIKN
jgi:M6 family metalloprotease-like protein